MTNLKISMNLSLSLFLGGNPFWKHQLTKFYEIYIFFLLIVLVVQNIFIEQMVCNGLTNFEVEKNKLYTYMYFFHINYNNLLHLHLKA